LLFNNTYDLPVLTTDSKCPNQVFYVRLVELNAICATYGLETWFTPNDDIRTWLLVMKHGSIKNAFWDVNNMKWRKWYKFDSSFLFNNTYGLTVHTKNTKIPNQVSYAWWSIYRLFVTNRCWKRDYLQIIIFVYDCSTWGLN
jgi:hypothetical protein